MELEGKADNSNHATNSNLREKRALSESIEEMSIIEQDTEL